jgi:hypothetical protein
VSLSLTDLPTHTQATITADLYVFGSWDGNSTTAGPDRVKVLLDGQTTADATFSNDPGVTQSFPDDYPASNPGQSSAVDIDTLASSGDGGSEHAHRMVINQHHR